MPTMTCQACQMPMESSDLYGTEADGSLNDSYCRYCYEDGQLAVFCQSCGMPLKNKEDYGTTADGSPAADYCAYCFQQGEFTSDISMEEMVQLCADMDFPMLDPQGVPLDRDGKVAALRQGFPTLRRWQAV